MFQSAKETLKKNYLITRTKQVKIHILTCLFAVEEHILKKKLSMKSIVEL